MIVENAVFCVCSAALFAVTFIGAAFYGAWWHWGTALGCAIMFWVLYTDRGDDGRNVRSVLKSKLSTLLGKIRKG